MQWLTSLIASLRTIGVSITSFLERATQADLLEGDFLVGPKLLPRCVQKELGHGFEPEQWYYCDSQLCPEHAWRFTHARRLDTGAGMETQLCFKSLRGNDGWVPFPMDSKTRLRKMTPIEVSDMLLSGEDLWLSTDRTS